MAAIQGAVRSERWLDEVVIIGISNNQDGDINDTIALPSGIGDVAIMEVYLNYASIATMATAPADLSGGAFILANDGSTAVDFVGAYRWHKVFVNGLAWYASPDPLVIWRQNELFQFQSPEIDTNASPTGDLNYFIKVVRVRPTETAVQGPLQLVR